MREDLLPRLDSFQFRLSILEGLKVLEGWIYRLTWSYAKLRIIGIWPEERNYNTAYCNQNDDEERDHGHLILLKALYAILEEC